MINKLKEYVFDFNRLGKNSEFDILTVYGNKDEYLFTLFFNKKEDFNFKKLNNLLDLINKSGNFSEFNLKEILKKETINNGCENSEIIDNLDGFSKLQFSEEFKRNFNKEITVKLNKERISGYHNRKNTLKFQVLLYKKELKELIGTKNYFLLQNGIMNANLNNSMSLNISKRYIESFEDEYKKKFNENLEYGDFINEIVDIGIYSNRSGFTATRYFNKIAKNTGKTVFEDDYE